VLSPAPTGTAAARAAASAAPATPINDAGAEAGNKRLAIDSTQKSVKDLQAKRTNLEGSVASSASSIAELESRLASLRTTHEAETSAVRALEERASKQAAELKTLREDVIRNESELSALRAEKDEVEQTVMRDREDVRDMKKRMGEVQNETIGLKSQLEKLRKEARQQKGLVAISKKQLATAEGESEKLRSDIAAVEAGETAAEEVKSPTIEPIGIKSPEAVLSPAASVRSTNPFDRFNPVSSPSSPATHNNAALALGGAAAGGALGLGAAAAVHSHEEASSTRAVGAPEGADPFGVPQTSQDAQPDSQAPAAPSAAMFDDSFGNDFDAPAAAPPASSQAAAPAGSAFDDAFADFDDKPAESAAAPATNDDTLAVSRPDATRQQSFDDFEASFAPPGALDSSVVQAPAAATAPQDEASVPAPTADEIATDADVIDEAPTADKGKGPATADDDDDSSDEDEGPEDLEAPRTASPDEDGFGKSTDTSTTTGAGAAAALPAAQNVNVAAERFPELDDADAAAVIAGSTAGQPQPASSTGSDAFLAATAPVSSQHTGASGSGDAFEDALTGDATAGFGAAAPASSAPSGSAALGAPSAADRSVSPNKTRRAPPPAPVRQNSIAAGSPFDAPATLPPTTAAPTHAPQTASFDDFDAAFEDLGPVSSAAPTSSAPAAAMPGFDDAFGDADDFDFVPSFDAAKASAPVAPADAFNSAFPPAAGGADAQTGGFGFDDFAASFGDPPAGASTAAAGGSGAGSGFSFADEFNPSQPAAASAAPPIPARSQTSGHKATPSGAEPDDAGPVKSLTSMGFDREKVIRALEASNYKVSSSERSVCGVADMSLPRSTGLWRSSSPLPSRRHLRDLPALNDTRLQ
jgi:epidermal growth factor receptor substrate 15